MPLKVAKRGIIPPFIVMDVMRAAGEAEARGNHILHMEVGQPSTPAPKGVLDAAREALSSDKLGYTDAFGVLPLRQRIVKYYRDEYDVAVNLERIVVTTGSSGAFLLAFLSSFDPGDRVALASPGYPAYRNILKSLNIEPVCVLVGPETNFQPTPEILDRVEGRLDGLIIASPSNPTGTMIHKEEMKVLANYCAKKGLRLISDEIYHGITYEEPATPALAVSDDAIIINSFSKYFSMTGWRLGWMVVPDSLIRPVECLAQNLFISPPTLSQFAAVAAFDCGEELDGNVQRYARNRELLLRELPKAGFDKLASAEGAFYIYADVAHLTDDSQSYCQRMLAETGVAATPGIDFDPDRGHHFIRFSFSGSTEDMDAAARRLLDWTA
ncbi:MAG: aminotransferase class I/II-fold pyridoxal phosphate-dependent enzyme [Rhodospirillales bacterium]|nr:aminotransferase class I/II-fold pyridoxal phosphate-dependent enzyme [Rhodospirillales bacterium]